MLFCETNHFVRVDVRAQPDDTLSPDDGVDQDAEMHDTWVTALLDKHSQQFHSKKLSFTNTLKQDENWALGTVVRKVR